MKNYTVTALTLLATLAGGAALHAETPAGAAAQKPQVVAPAAKAVEAVASKLSAEELAFAAKLSDTHRKVFSEKFTAEQRKVAMTAAKVSTAANAADEAVAKLLGAVATATEKSGADAAEAK